MRSDRQPTPPLPTWEDDLDLPSATPQVALLRTSGASGSASDDGSLDSSVSDLNRPSKMAGSHAIGASLEGKRGVSDGNGVAKRAELDAIDLAMLGLDDEVLRIEGDRPLLIRGFDGICDRCQQRSDTVQTHHVVPRAFSVRGDGRNRSEAKAPLCHACHVFVHSTRNVEWEYLAWSVVKDHNFTNGEAHTQRGHTPGRKGLFRNNESNERKVTMGDTLTSYPSDEHLSWIKPLNASVVRERNPGIGDVERVGFCINGRVFWTGAYGEHLDHEQFKRDERLAKRIVLLLEIVRTIAHDLDPNAGVGLNEDKEVREYFASVVQSSLVMED